MKELEERIQRDGAVREGNILKVDSFLNHQLDVALLDRVGAEFYRLYRDAGVTRIVTIEASGIAIASLTARYFGVPVVFAKKAKSRNLDGDLYTSVVRSFTYGREYNVTLAKKFLGPQDNVLLIDDFLADGKAMDGLLDICRQAGASVAGCGICIEKGFQPGGARLRAQGLRVESLAIVERMDAATGAVEFRAQ
jgi:xanthine phosphoribosyltransferase